MIRHAWYRHSHIQGRAGLVGMMVITFWSDIACSYCYIGLARLKRALRAVGMDQYTELRFRAYQLDSKTPDVTMDTMKEHLKKEYHLGENRVTSVMSWMDFSAQEEGLGMNIAQARPTNTLNALRLVKLAQTKGDPGLTDSVLQSLWRAHFEECKNTAVNAVLHDAATRAGLSGAEVDQVLASRQFEREVLLDEWYARRRGITGLPYYLIDGQFAIRGAQSFDTMVATLQTVLEQGPTYAN